MTQPLGNCPGCGGDEPFEQVHVGNCPDADGSEWACTACGAAVIMGTVPLGTLLIDVGAPASATPAGRAVRAA
jgi:hypothetical protein